MRRLRPTGRWGKTDAGFTLVELLVASAMGAVLLAALGTMVVSAMRSQPEVSKRAQKISEARWVLERLTREIRNGITVSKATPQQVTFQTYVRRTECGGTGTPPETAPAIRCDVTYRCTSTACYRAEAAPESGGPGVERQIFSGIDDSNVFSYSPDAEDPTFINITLHLPNPSGPADLTVSDGASLRNATLAN